MAADVMADRGVANIKWNAKELEQYNERQLQGGLDAVWIEFQRIVRKRAGIINTGQVIKLKRKKAKDTKREAGSRIPVYIPGVGWRMSKKRRRAGGIANKTQITVYPNSSRPGEPVRRRTGIGQKNIVGGRRGAVARVGYTRNAKYMTWHELGIRYPRGRQQRPLIIPALRDSANRLSALMARTAQSIQP